MYGGCTRKCAKILLSIHVLLSSYRLYRTCPYIYHFPISTSRSAVALAAPRQSSVDVDTSRSSRTRSTRVNPTRAHGRRRTSRRRRRRRRCFRLCLCLLARTRRGCVRPRAAESDQLRPYAEQHGRCCCTRQQPSERPEPPASGAVRRRGRAPCFGGLPKLSKRGIQRGSHAALGLLLQAVWVGLQLR